MPCRPSTQCLTAIRLMTSRETGMCCPGCWCCRGLRVGGAFYDTPLNFWIGYSERRGGIAMQAQSSLVHRGSVIMVAGAAIFLVYAIVFFFRALSRAKGSS